MDQYPTLIYICRGMPDPVQNSIIGRSHRILSMPADGRYKRCGRRVYDNRLYYSILSQPLKRRVVLFISQLLSAVSATMVILFNPVGFAVMYPPQSHRRRVHRPVVHTDVIFSAFIVPRRGRVYVFALVKYRVHKSFGQRPLA